MLVLLRGAAGKVSTACGDASIVDGTGQGSFPNSFAAVASNPDTGGV